MSAVAILLNAALRLHIAYFLYEVMTRPNDRRFAGKAIPIRNLAIVGGTSLLVPGLHALGRFRSTSTTGISTSTSSRTSTAAAPRPR